MSSEKSPLAAVGVDLGGTNLRAARIENGVLLGEPKYVPTPDSPEKIVEALINLIRAHIDEKVCGVGIATAGVVNCDTGEVVGSTGNLPGWAGTKIREVVEASVDLPVHVENDANAAAYAEAKQDDLKDKRCIVAITFGTGIGGGIVMDGNLLHGRGWAAGEIGHMSIALDDSRLCTCGLHNCWEAYGSGRGLKATALEILDGVSPDQTKLADLLEDISTYEIIEEMKGGDEYARKIFDKWHDHLAVGIVNLTHIMNPDCFVVSGGLGEVVDLELLRDKVCARTLHNLAETVEIRSSQLDTNAGLIGAAWCVVDRVLSCREVGSAAGTR